jgi:hypothetical protein
VELPTESWPAHDIRKCHIFHLAARFDDRGQAQVFRDRAAFFHDRCLQDINTFATRHLARPLILLAVYGHLHAYYCRRPAIDPQRVMAWQHDHDFGEPTVFQSPRERVRPLVRERLGLAVSEVRRIVRDRIAARRAARVGSKQGAK